MISKVVVKNLILLNALEFSSKKLAEGLNWVQKLVRYFMDNNPSTVLRKIQKTVR